MLNSVEEVAQWLDQSNYPQKIAIAFTEAEIKALTAEKLAERQNGLNQITMFLQQRGYAFQQMQAQHPQGTQILFLFMRRG